ncbi:MAG: hypothetical protein PWP24_240 [Clostridiales bacterium]|nr:hypothetical protein [Clostridiales bacterium]
MFELLLNKTSIGAKQKHFQGHALALFCILIWGTTFISTKVLLTTFRPIEILFLRFILAYVILWIIYPHTLKIEQKKQELLFMAAGICGVTLYFLFENIALTMSLASKVGVIVAISPFFTALISWLVQKNKRPTLRFFLGFALAISGIACMSLSSLSTLTFQPVGDILAILAAFIWAVYSSITKKISTYSYPILAVTRRIFFYGLVFMIPALFTMDFSLQPSDFRSMISLLNLAFLGILASALCFAAWNYSVQILGTIKTSVYIYMVTVVTAITSILILKEHFTWVTTLGIALTLLGLFLSESK